MDNQQHEEKTKHITLGLVLSWILGVIFLMSGAGLFTKSVFAGLLVLIGGLIMLPPINDLIHKKAGFRLSGALRFIAAIILVIIGASMSANETVNEVRQQVSSGESVTTEQGTEPESTAKAYQEVFTFKGTGAKQSEPFTITGGRFKIRYDCQGDLCQAFLYRTSGRMSQLIMNATGSVKDETIIYGSGEYYIDANTIGTYTMIVEDYK